MENYLKVNNIDHITKDPYNSQHQGAVKAFNKTIKIFDISSGSSKGKFCLVDFINDLLIYYNDRSHNTTQMRSFKLMTRLMMKNTQKKEKENTIKNRKN